MEHATITPTAADRLTRLSPDDADPAIDLLRLGPGRRLVRQGQPPHQVLVVRRGTATESGPGPARRFGPGDLIGLDDLLDGRPARATVESETDVEVLVVHATAARRLHTTGATPVATPRP